MAYLVAIAILGSLLAVLAALLIVARDVLVPLRTCTVDVNEGRRVLSVRTGQPLLEALYNEEVFIPSACGGLGTCGYCKLRVLAGGGPVLPTETPFLTPAEIRLGVRLACQVRVRGDLRVEIPPELLDVRRYCATVESARMLTRDVRELRLSLTDPPRIDHLAGQYIQVEVPADDGLALRAYSISSPPAGESGRIEIVVKLVPGGLGSTFLHRVQPGERIWFTGPYGDFRLPDAPGAELLCVAGGCGLAPVRNVVHTWLRRGPGRRCTLFLGCRTPADLFYRDELDRLADRHPALEVIYAVSNPPRRAGDWDGETGMIHAVLDRRLATGAAGTAFVCGPTEMIEAVTDVLTRKGMPARNIHCDAFSPAAPE